MTQPVPISALPAGSPVAGDEQIPAVQGGQTVRLPANEFIKDQDFFYFQEGLVKPFVTASAWRKRAAVRPLSIKVWASMPVAEAVSVLLTVDGVDYMQIAAVIPQGGTESTELDLTGLPAWRADAAIRVKMTAGSCVDLGVRVTYR